MHPLWFYKHQHDNRVRSKLFVACQRWWFQWRFAAILVTCAPSGEMHNYCTPHIIKENYENFLINRCNYMLLSQVYCVWQVVKTSTIIFNNPVYSLNWQHLKEIYCWGTIFVTHVVGWRLFQGKYIVILLYCYTVINFGSAVVTLCDLLCIENLCILCTQNVQTHTHKMYACVCVFRMNLTINSDYVNFKIMCNWISCFKGTYRYTAVWMPYWIYYI